MKINLSKKDVKNILINHSNEFLTTKQITNKLKFKSDDVMDRISNILYRLRNDRDIERVRSSVAFKYRYVEPTKHIPLIEEPTTESRDNDNVLTQLKQDRDSELDRYCFLEQLEEVEFGCCDRCEIDEIYWRAEVETGGIEFLCNKCGELVKEHLEANGGVIE